MRKSAKSSMRYEMGKKKSIDGNFPAMKFSENFPASTLPPGANPPMTRHFFETNSHVASVDFFYDSREVVKRFHLVPGVYLLIPCTYAADQPGEFLLRVLFEQADRTLE
ncbi:hypothetical protein ACTXT7_003423 [Hymenolepis weldensis]